MARLFPSPGGAASRGSDLALVRGIADTRRTFAAWRARPWAVVLGWTWRAAAVAALLLGAVLVIALFTTPDPSPVSLPGLTSPPAPGDVLAVLTRNGLVLALHSFACLAGFIAGSSLPYEAERMRGVSRWVHLHAGPAAIAFVAAATLFSLVTQAFVLGSAASSLAAQGGIGPARLLLGLLPHAVPELIALFLPLAAWLAASRRRAFDELLAATIVTTLLAIPVLIAAAWVEVHVSPQLLMHLAAR